MESIIAQRSFNLLYIVLDSLFCIFLLGLLIYKKRYATAIFGLLGGLLYFIVDFGIFHLLTHSRNIEGGSMFWVLLWMSMSYGFTNFSWIWLCLKKDPHAVHFIIIILLWWFCCPLLAETFGSGTPQIFIQRTTGAYHGFMALILAVSYISIIVYNLLSNENSQHFKVLWLMGIGISVQLGWELALLIGGVRSTEISDFADKLRVLVVNSLLETNLGLPAIYCIYLLYSSRFTETCKRKNAITFGESLRISNCQQYSLKKSLRP